MAEPSAVARLHHLVSKDGYTDRDVQALQEMADFGFHPEKAAGIVLVAKQEGRDVVAMARKFISFAKIVSGRG